MSALDPRLDWAPRHDPRSRHYAISDMVGAQPESPRTWELGPVLDQGREGACVGFGWTAELLASPRPHRVAAQYANAYARDLYRQAQRIDEWAGENYEGTSVLAGAKVVAERGFIGSYRWCFSIEDVRNAVIAEGPVVIGIPWYSGMYRTRRSGLVETSGQYVGGHCLIVHGYHPGMRLRGEDWHARFRVFRWRNSWGPGYGVNGNGFITYDALARLLDQGGEACVPQQRTLVRF